MQVEKEHKEQQQPQSRVLIVDDEPRVLRSLKAALKSKYDISVAASVDEAKELFEDNSFFNVIISDERMPDVSGCQFFQWVKDNHPESTRIMLTATDIEQLKKNSASLDIFQYLSKPWDVKVIDETIRRATDKSLEIHERKAVKQWAARITEQCIMVVLESEGIYIELYNSVTQKLNVIYKTYFLGCLDDVNAFLSKHIRIGILCVDLSYGMKEVNKLIELLNRNCPFVSIILTGKPSLMMEFMNANKHLEIYQHLAKPISLTRIEPAIIGAAKKYLEMSDDAL